MPGLDPFKTRALESADIKLATRNLDVFYGKIEYKAAKEGWQTAYDAERLRGLHALACAADLALQAGLTDASGWCPVDHLTWESSLLSHIHVIGDAAIQSPLPKSGFAANSEAKVCAANVVQLLRDAAPIEPSCRPTMPLPRTRPLTNRALRRCWAGPSPPTSGRAKARTPSTPRSETWTTRLLGSGSTKR